MENHLFGVLCVCHDLRISVNDSVTLILMTLLLAHVIHMHVPAEIDYVFANAQSRVICSLFTSSLLFQRGDISQVQPLCSPTILAHPTTQAPTPTITMKPLLLFLLPAIVLAKKPTQKPTCDVCWSAYQSCWTVCFSPLPPLPLLSNFGE